MWSAGSKPNTILFDFELAEINSPSAMFRNMDISGCIFHLCLNVWKKIRTLGLQVHYNNGQEFTFIFE